MEDILKEIMKKLDSMETKIDMEFKKVKKEQAKTYDLLLTVSERVA